MLRHTEVVTNTGCEPQNAREAGFSLLEMVVVVAVLMVIMGSVFTSINLTQKTSASEQVKLDITQQAREFIDQVTGDLRNAGYPGYRNMANLIVDPNNANSAPYNTFSSAYDPYNAPGLIFVDNGSLWLAAAPDGTTGLAAGTSNPGTANVKIVRYDLVQNGTNCPCLRRTEFPRNGGDPYTDAQNLGNNVQELEIQGVQNGTSAANAIFTVYDTTGAALTLPINWDANGNSLAQINSVKVVLTVQSPNKDYTGAHPATTIVSTIALMNCSHAMANGQTPLFCN